MRGDGMENTNYSGDDVDGYFMLCVCLATLLCAFQSSCFMRQMF